MTPRSRAPRGDGPSPRIAITVPEWLLRAIEREAAREGISRSGWIARELAKLLEKERPK